MKSGSNRKLSTILFSDIVGYSKIMNKNEEYAMKLLRFHDRIAEEIFSSNQGTIIKKLGDGLLAEFNKVTDAYEAAKMFQEEIKMFNSESDSGNPLIVRIGIHVGNVLEIDGDLHGNGVNVAARLQQICTPGGICLSMAAHSALGSMSHDEFTVIPNIKLKNIAESYTIYQTQSIYPKEYPINTDANFIQQEKDFKILSMKKIPPEKFSLIDSILIALAIVVTLDFLAANIIMYFEEVNLNRAILKLSGDLGFLVFNLITIIIFTISILRDSVEIKFEDVRGADQLLSYVIQRFGFKPPRKKGDHLVFAPTLYNVFMWSSQRTRVVINGNKVSISGSFLFLKKVKKMLKQFQK